MIAVYKMVNGHKVYFCDSSGNIQLFPSMIEARISLAMTGFTEDRITGEGLIFENWDEFANQKVPENEKKLQEQIEQLDKRVKELEKIIGAERIAKIIDALCDLGSCPQTLPDDYKVDKTVN